MNLPNSDYLKAATVSLAGCVIGVAVRQQLTAQVSPLHTTDLRTLTQMRSTLYLCKHCDSSATRLLDPGYA
jgi:hypothetical protein